MINRYYNFKKVRSRFFFLKSQMLDLAMSIAMVGLSGEMIRWFFIQNDDRFDDLLKAQKALLIYKKYHNHCSDAQNYWAGCLTVI
ncbi:hypothetical protein LX69_00028 [Breznakibacter xylanolyticus]|uniref:Uncharacterized protein n=1 Tax=Breznakibacter xylanolyticus TaxID=990 RepID=A0A2W7NR85_9BACT|nr:hypothetical protein LX69_00028 [Breznakibacter xylanolyticus]